MAIGGDRTCSSTGRTPNRRAVNTMSTVRFATSELAAFRTSNGSRTFYRLPDPRCLSLADVGCRCLRSHTMPEHTWWETIKIESDQLVQKVKELIEEGNVRRIVIKHGDHT